MAPSCWLTWIKAREMGCTFWPRPPSAGPEVGLSLVEGSPTWCGTGSRQLTLQILPRDAARTWEGGGTKEGDTVRSRDMSRDTIPEARDNISVAGGLGAVAACSRRARRVCCTRPGLRIWGRGHGA